MTAFLLHLIAGRITNEGVKNFWTEGMLYRHCFPAIGIKNRNNRAFHFFAKIYYNTKNDGRKCIMSISVYDCGSVGRSIQLKTCCPYNRRVFEILDLSKDRDNEKLTAILSGGLKPGKGCV